MKQRKKLGVMAFAAIFVFAACVDDYAEDPAFNEEITTQLMDKSELPEWLVDYVTHLEYVPEGQQLPSEPSGIFRFEWRGDIFYEIYHAAQGVMHTDIHTADGTLFYLTEKDYKSFSEEVHNWTIIYMLHPTHEKPQKRTYPEDIQDQDMIEFFENAFYMGYFRGLGYYNTSECVLIDSETFLKNLYHGYAQLPQIDFDKFILIIGRIKVNKSAGLKWQEILHEDGCYTLRLYFEDDAQDKTITQKCFWALYPKLSSDSLQMKLVKNYDMANATTQTIFKPLAYLQQLWDNWNLLGTYKMYLDSYTTADGIRHQVSEGQGNPNFYIQTRGNFLYGKINDNRILAFFNSIPQTIYTGEWSTGEFSITLFDVSSNEENNANAQYFMQHIGEVKHYFRNDNYYDDYLKLAISDNEYFEFCSDKYYRDYQKYQHQAVSGCFSGEIFEIKGDIMHLVIRSTPDEHALNEVIHKGNTISVNTSDIPEDMQTEWNILDFEIIEYKKNTLPSTCEKIPIDYFCKIKLCI